MNIRGVLALVKLTWATWFAQRSFFFILAFGWMIPPLIYMFVWSTAAGEESIGGFSQGQFISYYLIFIIVNQITFSTSNWTVGDGIRDGYMNTVLLRPLAPITDALANDLASKGIFILFDLPIVIILALVMKPEIDISTANALLFVLALIMAALLRFLWGYALALLSFWATRADSLLAIQDSLIFLLAGQVAPVALLPGIIKDVALVLPFRYMVGFPIEVLMGQQSNAEIVSGLVVQFGWLATTTIVAILIWNTGIRRYEAVGG